ncbi:hypothetical protein T484DRAFT_1961166 [Baffinella frigidus]|nr:hypothetical protein T484DRAFT_1961166 [Cryptophyta sp. CCMP2293]
MRCLKALGERRVGRACVGVLLAWRVVAVAPPLVVGAARDDVEQRREDHRVDHAGDGEYAPHVNYCMHFLPRWSALLLQDLPVQYAAQLLLSHPGLKLAEARLRERRRLPCCAPQNRTAATALMRNRRKRAS